MAWSYIDRSEISNQRASAECCQVSICIIYISLSKHVLVDGITDIAYSDGRTADIGVASPLKQLITLFPLGADVKIVNKASSFTAMIDHDVAANVPEKVSGTPVLALRTPMPAFGWSVHRFGPN